MSEHDDVLAALKTTGHTVHDGWVPDLPAYPYVLLTAQVPRTYDRALTRSPHSARLSWVITCVGLSQAAALIVTRHAAAALEGARIGGERLELEPTGLGIQQDEEAGPAGQVVHFTKLTAGVTVGREETA